MSSGIRSSSLSLPGVAPSSLVQSLDGDVEYLDRHGVPRRGSSVSRRLLMRGSSLSSLDVVRTVQEPQAVDSEDEKDDDHVQDPLDAEALEPLSLEEKLALERARYAKMLRRKQLIVELRERKLRLLVDQHADIIERIQLWHYVQEVDPNVELTSANTVYSPSSKSNTYVDDDGNVRRKSVSVDAEPKFPSSSSSSALAAAAIGIVRRKSAVLEFMQIMLED